MFKTDAINLQKLNILTKYPSIYTRHELDNKGQAQGAIEVSADEDETFYLTEKIDGTNSRIIIFPDFRYIIGSREDFLTADGDLIKNKTLGIVDTVIPYAERIKSYMSEHKDLISNNVIVIYGETFGGHTHKNGVAYSGDRLQSAFRMFDIQKIDINTLEALLEKDETRISTWREHNNQNWFTVDELEVAQQLLEIPLVPPIAKIKGSDIPKDPSDIPAWINSLLPETKIKLDSSAKGFAEGIIARSSNRKTIMKIRNSNYKKYITHANNPSPCTHGMD